jgi:hypothetical protein
MRSVIFCCSAARLLTNFSTFVVCVAKLLSCSDRAADYVYILLNKMKFNYETENVRTLSLQDGGLLLFVLDCY